MPTADYEQRVTNALNKIDKSDGIHARNKEFIREYQRDQTLNSMADATLSRNLNRMKIIAEHVDMPFSKMDKANVKDLVKWVHSQDYADGTVYTYKNVIRYFWKWMNPTNDGDAPRSVVDHYVAIKWR